MKKLIVILLLPFLLVGCVNASPPAPAQPPQGADNVTRQAIQILQRDVASLNASQNDTKRQLDSISANISTILTKQKAIEGNDAIVMNSITNLPDRIATLEKQVAQLKANSTNNTYDQLVSQLANLDDIVQSFSIIRAGNMGTLAAFNYYNNFELNSQTLIGSYTAPNYIAGVVTTINQSSAPGVVKLLVGKIGNPGTCTLNFVSANMSALPGTVLASFNINPASQIGPYGLAWIWGNCNSILLSPGTYFLILNAPSGDPNNYVYIACDTATGFSNSMAIDSIDGGTTWARHYGSCFGFEIWGKTK